MKKENTVNEPTKAMPYDALLCGVTYKKTKGGYDISNFREWKKTGAGWELMYKNEIYIGEVNEPEGLRTVYFDKYGRVSNRLRADCDVDINAT